MMSNLVFAFLLAHLSLHAVQSGDGFNIDCPPKPTSLPDLIRIGIPDGCVIGSDGSSCHQFIMMAPNLNDSEFLDIYMEGSTKGWIAVGFSRNKLMENSDVLGCKQDSSGNLGIINSWNPSPNHNPNEINPTQDGMCLYNITYENKRIFCSFSRYSGIVNNGYDYNLTESYYLLYGQSDTQSNIDTSLPIHTVQPRITDSMFNAYDYNANNSNGSASGEDKLTVRLIKAHGALMVIAWPLLAVTAIFFAAWMKPALQKGKWFQFHRALMIMSLVIAMIAFVLVFVANRNNSRPGLIEFKCGRTVAHLIIGIIVMGLQMLNPLIALCRCKQESKYRWIFNLVHGSGIGIFTELLALVNTGLGLVLFQSHCGALTGVGNHMLWLYLGWVCFLLLVQSILFSLTTVSALKSHGEERYNLAPSLLKPFLKVVNREEYIGLSKSGEVETDIENMEEFDFSSRISKDSSIRTGAFGIFTIVTLMVVTILVVLIGINDF